MQGEEQQVQRRELAWPFEDPQRAREAGTEWAGGDGVREVREASFRTLGGTAGTWAFPLRWEPLEGCKQKTDTMDWDANWTLWLLTVNSGSAGQKQGDRLRCCCSETRGHPWSQR